MKKRKLVLVGIMVCGLTGGALLAGREFIGEADGTVQPKVQTPTPDATVNQRIGVTGRFASFSYPTKFITQPTESAVAPVVERYNFRKQQVNAWQIAITITRLGTGRLEDDASFNYREQTPGRFDRQEQRFGSNEVIVFTDKTADAFSRVAFLQDGALGASIAISGGTTSNVEQVEADFEAMIASWQWR